MPAMPFKPLFTDLTHLWHARNLTISEYGALRRYSGAEAAHSLSMSCISDSDIFRSAVRVLANLTDCIEPYAADVKQLKEDAAEDFDLPLDELATRIILRELYRKNAANTSALAL